jgi:hypothetical protein
MRRKQCLVLVLLVFLLGFAARVEGSEYQVDLANLTAGIDIPEDTDILKLKSGRFLSVFVRTDQIKDVSYILGSVDIRTIKNTKFPENPLNFFDPHYFMTVVEGEEFIQLARTLIKTGRVQVSVEDMAKLNSLSTKHEEAINVELLTANDALKERAGSVRKGDVVKISGLMFKLEKEFLDDVPFSECPYMKTANFLYLKDLTIISRMDGPISENSFRAQAPVSEPRVGNPSGVRTANKKMVTPIILIAGLVLTALAVVGLLKK